MSKLTTPERNSLPDTDFVFPDTREYPIEDISHARNALARGAQNETGSRLQKIRDAVYRKFPSLRHDDTAKKAEAESVDVSVPLWKNEEQRLVYGVVLTPGVEDSQGDIVSAEEIQKAAHRFLVEFRKHDVQHDEREAQVQTVESFIAPDDMTISGQHVRKGAWVLAAKVNDDQAWDRVRKGELTGWSIGGSGVRVPIAA